MITFAQENFNYICESKLNCRVLNVPITPLSVFHSITVIGGYGICLGRELLAQYPLFPLLHPIIIKLSPLKQFNVFEPIISYDAQLTNIYRTFLYQPFIQVKERSANNTPETHPFGFIVMPSSGSGIHPIFMIGLFSFYDVYMCFTCMDVCNCVCTMLVRALKRIYFTMELELQTVVNCQVGARNMWFQPLSCFSSLPLSYFCLGLFSGFPSAVPLRDSYSLFWSSLMPYSMFRSTLLFTTRYQYYLFSSNYSNPKLSPSIANVLWCRRRQNSTWWKITGFQ